MTINDYKNQFIVTQTLLISQDVRKCHTSDTSSMNRQPLAQLKFISVISVKLYMENNLNSSSHKRFSTTVQILVEHSHNACFFFVFSFLLFLHLKMQSSTFADHQWSKGIKDTDYSVRNLKSMVVGYIQQ